MVRFTLSCAIDGSELEALGSNTFTTDGLTIVEIIRKNNNKKNMMSFSEAVYTSAEERRDLDIFIM
jgi:hypothetical protein